MNKIIINQKQKTALVMYKKVHGNKIEPFIKHGHEWEGDLQQLNVFSINDFSLILNGWYIFNNFTVGDWAVYTNLSEERMVSQITRIEKGDHIYGYWNNRGQETWVQPKDLVTATKEEIEEKCDQLIWKEVGRAKDDYRIGDIVEKKGSHGVRVIVGHGLNNTWLLSGQNAGFYNDEIRMCCPVEWRLDMKWKAKK